MSSKKNDKLELFHFWTRSERPPANAFVSTFEDEYGIEVSKNILDWSTYTIITSSRMAKGNPPDILMGDVGQRLAKFVRSSQLKEITDIWEEENFFDAFPEWITNACTVKEEMYGVPSKYFTFPMWYLTSTFEEHGLTPPETWEEFIEICDTLKKADTPPIIASDWGTSLWFQNLLVRKTGAEFYNGLMEGKESWEDEKVIETHKLLRNLVNDYFYPYPFRQTFPAAWDKLNEGEAAMILQGDWVNGMWKREYEYTPGEEYDYFFLPPIDQEIEQTMIVGGNTWMLPKKAPHLEKARKFLSYAGSLKSQKMLAKEDMGILPHKEVPKNAYDSIYGSLREEINESQTVVEMGTALPPWVASVEELQRIQILLSPSIEKEKIKNQLAEIDSAVKKAPG